MQMIESLENRRLLAATTVTFAAGVVTVTGGGNAESINVIENSGAVHVEIGTTNTQYDFVGATAVRITGSTKNDTIYYTGNSIGANINGIAGNDQISVDDAGTGSSIVNGDKGDDVITVIHGNNTAVAGGSGNDQIYVNTDGSAGATTVVDAGKGNDTVTFYGGSATLNGGAGTDTLIIAGAGSESDSNFESIIVL
jgi:Ca2+-binding RTX toxin-like protein